MFEPTFSRHFQDCTVDEDVLQTRLVWVVDDQDPAAVIAALDHVRQREGVDDVSQVQHVWARADVYAADPSNRVHSAVLSRFNAHRWALELTYDLID
jgi:hypothetical protein